MFGRPFKLSLVAALGLATLCLIAQSVAASGRAAALKPVAPLGGVNIGDLSPAMSPAQAERPIAQAHALGAKIVRIEVPWSSLEPEGPGQLNPRMLPAMDRFFGYASSHAVKVIVLVDFAPCWASSAPEEIRHGCAPGSRGRAESWPASNPADYAAVVRRLTERYRNSITALEVWNEPDQANELYFAGPEKPRHYAEALRAAYTAVKQADPSVLVLAGSLVGSNGAFLRLLYQAGIKGYYDGLSIHFYTLTLAGIRSFRAAQQSAGDSAPLWLDEFGWPSCYPHQQIEQEQACVTPAVQASNVANLYRAVSRVPYVAAQTLFQLSDARPGDDFGVLTRQGARKPSYRALARVLASPFSPTSPVTLRLRRVGGHVVASGSAPVGDYMQLETIEAGVLRFKATFTLDRFNRYSIALPSVLGTRHLRVRVYQEGSGPASATQRRT